MKILLIYFKFLCIILGGFQIRLASGINNYTVDTFNCCTQVFGLCQQACQNLSLADLGYIKHPILRDPQIQSIKRSCSSSNFDFWNCINDTLLAVSRGSQWAGRPCCSLGISVLCQNTCATAASRNDIGIGCRKSDEQNLFTCVDRQEKGDECCGNARNPECLEACRTIFLNHLTPTQDERTHALTVCNDSNPIVNECIRNLTSVSANVNLKKYLPCCEKSNEPTCRATCEKALTTLKNPEEVIDKLQEGGCGVLLPYDPLWQCMLSPGKTTVIPSSSAETSRINQIGMDSAKLHCCYKSTSAKCRRLCIMTYSNDWTDTQENFDVDCLSQINEINLKRCLDEVDEPCELGCNNNSLSFCKTFNNRPAELFRSCTKEADEAAQADVNFWQSQGILRLPNLDLPIRNISQCSPEVWKVIACTLQIRPCTNEAHYNQICREDCFNILSKCLDWTRMLKGYTASFVCKNLSIDDDTTPCVSLNQYLESSGKQIANSVTTSPCRSFPCNLSKVCSVNRNVDQDKKFTCATGCPLGEASAYHVAIGAYVRIPISPIKNGCLKICKCAKSGRLEKCQPLPCITYDSCITGGKTINHGSWFSIECNICSCFAGEITCTKKQCKMAGKEENLFTGLPCNCPLHYVPVCGRNGVTYSSSCVAKCTGLQDNDFEFGSCRSRNPCENNNCSSQSICIPDYQICLSVMHKPCHQYQCVNLTSAYCTNGKKVCDNQQKTYLNICQLIKSKSQLGYYGACIKGCSGDGPVCGINGITYNSECEAWSDYSMIDYNGMCRQIGIISEYSNHKCTAVKCASLLIKNCKIIIPPGACCPICSDGIKMIYSRKQIDRALYALHGHEKKAVSLKSILRSLELLIQVAQCRLVGFLTMETDLFISIRPINDSDPIILEICNKEAQKITTLISTRSHRISCDLGLSALTVANVIQTNLTNFSTKIELNFILLSFSLYILSFSKIQR